MATETEEKLKPTSLTDRLIFFFLENKLVTFLWIAFIILLGFYVMPFQQKSGQTFRNPLPVDAIPDIGEKQQIVFVEWPGRSPQDVEDQVTYPLTITLQGVSGVKAVRSLSMFGFATIYVIFRDDVDFYWARSRVLERLNIAQQRLPRGVVPALGPDATGLGQIFWYTLEGKGFDLQELRSIQDWYVRYALQSVEGVSEVASVGGYLKEYQVDVDPNAMRAYGVMLADIVNAVEMSNTDVGAETLEFNGVEYIIRSKGFIKTVADIENIVVKSQDNVPVLIRNVGRVVLGPALRRGVLDKNGAEAVGGVVTCRYGENPLAVINRVKDKIKEITPGLPQKKLADGTTSQVKLVSFYDRTRLINETLNTLKESLILEILITCFVIFLILNQVSSGFIISINLFLAILLSFGFMKLFGVQSNLMSLGGLAISIGVMVDVGILMCENTLRHFTLAKPKEKSQAIVYRASSEIGSAVVTAILTTVVSFLPIFALTGPEGKLFKPLAYTKTFALIASVIIALTVVPTLCHLFLGKAEVRGKKQFLLANLLLIAGLLGLAFFNPWIGSPLLFAGVFFLLKPYLTGKISLHLPLIAGIFASLFILLLLTRIWMPLGFNAGFIRNFIIVLLPGLILGCLAFLIIRHYQTILGFLLRKKALFLSFPIAVAILGLVIWLGFSRVFAFLPLGLEKIGLPQGRIETSRLWTAAHHKFPGLGREFMPSLEEGDFLLMPITMPYASLGSAYEIMQKQDIAIGQIPEIENVVGKLGRAETALDPAPVNMIETLITYKPEYGPPDPGTGKRPRLWRDEIKTTDDIWREIIKAADILGSTGAPKLQPIAARLVMLQSGMRAPMGIKVFGNNLKEIEAVGFKIAQLLKDTPGVNPDAVIPEWVIAKPYLVLQPDREAIARYGLMVKDVQEAIEVAVGGMVVTTTVEERERYPVRIRYLRELRDTPEELSEILIPTPSGAQIPLGQLARMEYVTGPQEIKSENTFPVSYVLFDKKPGYAEVEVVEAAKNYLQDKVAAGELVLPAGTYYNFAGNYENQVNFQKRLAVILPAALFLIFLILYFQFRATSVAITIFIQLFFVWAGGVAGLWLVGQGWFFNFSLFGFNLRELYHLRTYFLSVPVWVGFIALFGIATDDAVVMATYLTQRFKGKSPTSKKEIHQLVVEAASKRIRPCLLTTVTTILALLPILTSTGKGAEIMTPMAIPIIFGMSWELVTLYTTPVIFCWIKERQLKKEAVTVNTVNNGF